MSERAQALEVALRKLRNECHAIKAMSYDEIRASAGYTNLKCWMDRMDEADALLALPAPAVGGPQPGRASDVLGDMDSVGPLLHAPGKPLSPVEPTPEPHGHLGSSDACYYADHKRCAFPSACNCPCHSEQSVEPAPPAPAPCVWREFPYVVTTCGQKRWWPTDMMAALHEFKGCPYCLKPLEITR